MVNMLDVVLLFPQGFQHKQWEAEEAVQGIPRWSHFIYLNTRLDQAKDTATFLSSPVALVLTEDAFFPFYFPFLFSPFKKKGLKPQELKPLLIEASSICLEIHFL